MLTTWARSIVVALEARGLDGRALAAEAGIDPASIADPVGRAPVTATGRLWRLAVEASGDPCFGLFASRFFSFPTFQALGVAVLASATVREAFSRLVRYSRIISDAADYRLVDDGAHCRLEIHVAPEARLEVESVDAIASLKVRTIRSLYGDRSVGPVAVALERSRPEASAAFARFFRAPVEFGASGNFLVFERALIDAPLPGGQREIALRSDEVMAGLLASHDEADLKGRVKAAVRESLASGEPSAAAIADALGMGMRTLQRRLAERGTSFATVVAQVREELAREYLREGSWSITEIAFALGFADVSSFSRAFRKWTGMSPSGWRG